MNKKKIAAIGAAGVVALGGAGLYAGSLTPTTSGTLGAGSVAVQASCTSGVNIVPGAAAWDVTDARFEYTTLTVTPSSGDFTACDTRTATVNVFNTPAGTVIASGTNALDSGTGDPEETSFSITLNAGVDAGLATSAAKYGIVIQ